MFRVTNFPYTPFGEIILVVCKLTFSFCFKSNKAAPIRHEEGMTLNLKNNFENAIATKLKRKDVTNVCVCIFVFGDFNQVTSSLRNISRLELLVFRK